MSARGPDEEEGGFLRNWSRRKIAARRAEAQPKPEAVPAPEPEAPAEDEIDLSDLPSLDEITAETDMRPFMRKGVPASLRSDALRRAWSLSSHIRDYSDPAVDYAWDWNAPGGVPGGGGVLDDDSVRRMVSDIFRQKTPDTPAPVREDRPAAADAVGSDEAPEPAPAPVRSEPGPQPAPPKAPDSEAQQVVRRHGSARPSFGEDGDAA